MIQLRQVTGILLTIIHEQQRPCVHDYRGLTPFQPSEEAIFVLPQLVGPCWLIEVSHTRDGVDLPSIFITGVQLRGLPTTLLYVFDTPDEIGAKVRAAQLL